MRFGTMRVVLVGVALFGGLCAKARGDEPEAKRYTLEFEAGPVWQGRNDVRLPGNTGTRFSLVNLQGGGPYTYSRMYLTYTLNKRAELRFLYAPLSFSGTGTFGQGVAFAGQNYAAGTPTTGSYQFNNYRLTYRVPFYKRYGWEWKWGGTILIRDARIGLQQGATSSSDYNLGFAPLLHLAGDWDFAPKWRLSLDFDGLAAPQGRAFDLSLKLGYQFAPNWSAAFGYRTLEGGADNKQVYNFAWFNYMTFSLARRF